MKKLKHISLILILSVGLFSCEAERPDLELNNEFNQGEQIFRFELDGKTKVTKDVSVITTGSSVIVTGRFKDELAEYKTQTFSIAFDKLETGNYISVTGNIIVDETVGFCSASFKNHDVTWAYSTDNVRLPNPTSNVQTGNLEILSINDKAKYFEGKFEFNLYPPQGENVNNTIPPLRISKGYFQYVKYN